MKPGAGTQSAPSASRPSSSDLEAELLGELARRGGAWRLARLDETGGDLPQHRSEADASRAVAKRERWSHALRSHTQTRPSCA